MTDAPSTTTNPSRTDAPPDRLCADPGSPYYDAAVLERDVGVRFKGVEKTNVEEYCVSEGWVRLTAGAARDRAGRPMTIKLKGPVEPYFRRGAAEAAEGAAADEAQPTDTQGSDMGGPAGA